MENRLILSPSPHIHGKDSVSRIMFGVVIALLPAYGVSLYFFGLGAFIVTLTAVASCLFFEWFIQRFVFKRAGSLRDGSALVTGLLLALNLPSNLPVLQIVLGSLVAIGVGKMTFGGLGNNVFNPALVGRVFLLISYPEAMTSWPIPGCRWEYLDATTAATPLAALKMGNGASLDALNLLLGNCGGSLGEVSAVALLVGFAFLLWRKIITWHIPVAIFVSVAVFSLLIGEDPLLQLLSGGLMLGAIFMATDYVTSPMSRNGMLLYGCCIRMLTVLIRNWSAYPEGMSFAILIMNAFTPLINTYMKPKRFGEEVQHG